ncbi:hypothetical protein LTS10_003300 [Elasticomyces elasticus]|nr:hypothetical protein LTS10_003300 [Elasticomyces elasticus]
MAQNNSFVFGANGQFVHMPPQQPPTQPLPPSNGQYASMPPPPQVQQAQQAAFQQNAALPAATPNLADLLAGIRPEQVAAIVALVQSGQLSLPQLSGLTQPVAAPAPAVPSQPVASLPQASNQVNGLAQQDVNMDKEDGELEDGEEAEAGPAKEREFLRPPPTGPRKRSPSPRARQPPRKKADRRASSPRPTEARHDLQRTQNGNAHAAPALAARSNANGVDSGAAAKAFVLQMHNTGYTFEQLARELPNRKALARMYKAMNLPMQAENAMRPVNGNAAQPPQPLPLVNAAAQAQPSATSETRSASLTKRVPPVKPAAPLDRTAYLAKLAAAKNPKGKAAAVAPQAATPVQAPPTLASQAAPAHIDLTQQNPPAHVDLTQSSPATPALVTKSTEHSSASKSTIQTSLIRERLEKLKAEQAAKANATQNSNQGPASSSPAPKLLSAADNLKQVLGIPATTAPSYTAPASINMASAPVPTQTSAKPTFMPPPALYAQPPSTPSQSSYPPAPPTPVRSFSGLPGLSLPGLFMANTPVQPSPSFQQPPPAPPNTAVPKPSPPAFGIPAFHAPAPALSAPVLSAPASKGPASSVPTMNPPATGPLATSAALAAFSAQYAPSPTGSPGPLNIARKRPVAADFDAELISGSAPSVAKRPFSFGQSRSNSESERLVIEVSDDDDEDAMEVEPTPMRAPALNGNVQRSFARPSGTLPGLAPGAPAFGGAVDIASKDKAIAEMKRQIAEREAQRKASKANGRSASTVSATASGISTPVLPPPSPLVVQTKAAEVGSQASPPNSASVKSPTSTASSTLSVAAIAREQERARLNQRFRELQAQMSGQTGVAAIASPAATPQHASLGGVASDEQAVQETNIGEASSEDAATSLNAQAGTEALAYDESAATEPRNYIDIDQSTSADAAVDDARASIIPITGEEEPSVDNTQASVVTQQPASTETMLDLSEPNVSLQVSDAASPNNEDVDMDVDSSEDEGEVQEEIVNVEEAADLGDTDEPMAAAQTGTTASSFTASAGAQPEAQVIDDDTSSGSSTESEDYEPEPLQEAPSEDGEIEDEEEGEEDDEEDYEPAPGGDNAAISSIVTDALKPDTDGAGKMSGSSVSGVPVLTSNSEGPKYELSDELAPELQPEKEEQVDIEDEHKRPASTHYRPYESVLTKFHDFRYHPEYSNVASEGYNSVTFSNNIDPDKPLCLYEAAGGQCNDSECENQHFRTMGLNDNEFLKALTANRIPTSTPEETTRWRSGLTAVFQELRSRKVNKDAAAIAARIVQYRREFLGNPNKVLYLGLD